MPFLGLTIFASRRLSQSIDVWQSPGTKRALESSLVLARKSLSKYEEDLRLLAPQLAGDRPLVRLLKAQRWKDSDFLLREYLEPFSVDFLQVYEEKNNTWNLRVQVADTAVAPPGAFSDDLMRRALESDDVIRSEAGYIALPVRLANAEAPAAGAGSGGADAGDASSGVVVVAGYWLGDDFFPNVREVTDALVYYGQLEIYKRVAKQSVWVTAAILFGAAVVVSLLIAALLARQLSKPILGLAEGMKRVAAGRLDEKVSVRAGGEIGYLVESFNQMTQDLRLYKDQLARAERIAAWQDVARYVAHEIRNPLTPIKISLHRLRSFLERLNEEEKRRFVDSLESVLGELNSLERLATAFSEFAKLPEPVLAPVDINKLIGEVAELYRPAPATGAPQAALTTDGSAQTIGVAQTIDGDAQARGGAAGPQTIGGAGADAQSCSPIAIDLTLDSSLPAISADAQQIRMAFVNIVKNAIEAMPEGGTLRISSKLVRQGEGRSGESKAASQARIDKTAAKDYAEITFSDTGCGISEALIGSVMTPHFTTKKGGTGLGLTVVSKVISQHGGRVYMQSREAKGTTVTILLPIQYSVMRAAS